jgi:hypothetical protein
MNYIRRKKPELWGNPSSPIFPTYVRKSDLELCLAQAAGLLGNLAARQTDQQRASHLARGKVLPQSGNLKRELRSCWDSGEKGSKQELPSLALLIIFT